MLSGSFGAWLQETLYFLPALLIALSVHEFAHAYVAYKLGDRSQKTLGRLTISPLAHIDPIGFIFMLVFKFGWGKPVRVDDRNFTHRRKAMMWISLAGPMSNVILAIVFTILLKLLEVFGVLNMMAGSSIGQMLTIMLFYAIQFNMVFAVFNLIPIPPFDGSKVLYYFLPYKGKQFMDRIEQYSIWILIFLMITDLYVIIIQPAYSLLGMIINWILMI